MTNINTTGSLTRPSYAKPNGIILHMDYNLLLFLLDNANIINIKHGKENQIVVFSKLGKH